MDNKFDGNNEVQNDINANNESEVAYASTDTGSDAHTEDFEKIIQNEEKADAYEEEAACEKEEADSKEVQPEVKANEYVWSSDGEYHFKPENMKEYTGTGFGDAAEENQKKKREKKKTVLWLLPVAVAFALVIGIAGGIFLSNILFTQEVDFYDETLITNISKNEAPVDVTVIVDEESKTMLSRIEVVEKVSGAVVEVTTSNVVRDALFGNYVRSGAGSGVVIAQNEKYAYIVTNYHVVEGASTITVRASDGEEFEVEYLDGDANMDIAMLRIETTRQFPKIDIGSSSSIRVGEDVIAIGNALGELGGTVTDGIVSALDRRITIEGKTMVLLQTSAAVNPGNSGGGLFNMAGQLVGIVNAKESATGVEGLGFAIPIDRIYESLIEIMETNYIHGRPTLNFETEYVSDLWEARVKYKVNTTGVFVTSSQNEEIHVGDLIKAVNGQLITDDTSYVAAVTDLEVGQTIKIDFYRAGNDGYWYEHSAEVVVEEYVPAGIF